MGTQRAAVLGVGQTKYDTTYPGSMAGMLREAATNALEMSGKSWADIDAVIMGKAPDFFEGVMMPEVYLAEALGCVGKPIMRVHTAGSVGGSTACVATSMIQSGVHETVLTIGWEKQSESNAMWALSLPQPDHPSLHDDDAGTRADRLHGGLERSQARTQQPVRAPASAGPHVRAGGRVADVVGPDPL